MWLTKESLVIGLKAETSWLDSFSKLRKLSKVIKEKGLTVAIESAGIEEASTQATKASQGSGTGTLTIDFWLSCSGGVFSKGTSGGEKE